MEDNAFYIIFVGSFFGLFWVFYKQKFTRYICDHHETIYHSLGSPPIKQKRFYSLNDIQGGFSELRYLLSGDYKKANDPQLDKIGNRLRLIFVIQTLLMIYILFYIVIPLSFSSSNCTNSYRSNNSIHKAYMLYQKGELNNALHMLDEIIINDAENSEAYFYRGIVLEHKKEYDNALDNFLKSAEIDPNHYESYKHIDWHYSRQHKFSKIVAYWNTFITHNPNHAQAYLERGGAYYQMNNIPKAMQDAKKSCSLGNNEGCNRYRQLQEKVAPIDES